MAIARANPGITIRELSTVAELELAIQLEKEVWRCDDSDVVPITLAVATRAAGSIWLGAFEGDDLIGFAFALPSFDEGGTAFHSHTLGVGEAYQSSGVGYQLKLAQREKALAMGIKKMTWTFDPLRSRNAHLNFCKLGVISDRYEIDFYGSKSSSPMHSNSTDRLWVTWSLAEPRVDQRLKRASGADESQNSHAVAKSATRVGQPSGSVNQVRVEMLDALAHLDPLVRFNGNGRPAESELAPALARQRIAIEIPGDIGRIERDDIALGREWRQATRRAFTESVKAGFVVKEFCRSIRGQQGPGAYLLERQEK